jgi:AcrR family transcriptional regulator
MIVPMKRPPPDLTSSLLASTPVLLRPEGVPRFEEVAELVGVSRATLYYYFSGQDDLLSFLLIAHVEEGAAVMAVADSGSGPVPDRLRAVISAVATFLGERPWVCSGLLSAASSGPQMRQVLEINDAQIAEPIRKLVTAGAGNADFHVHDAADTTNAILGAVLMAVLGRAARGGDPASADFRDAVVDQILRGLSPP